MIPLKARAWLDLSERKRQGHAIDSKDIRKHKNDVFRLLQVVDPDLVGAPPKVIQDDLAQFLSKAEAEVVDLKALGLGKRTFNDVAIELRAIYGLD